MHSPSLEAVLPPGSVVTEVALEAGQGGARLRAAAFTEHDGPADLSRAVRCRIEESAGLLASYERPVLCHNDLHEGNMLT